MALINPSTWQLNVRAIDLRDILEPCPELFSRDCKTAAGLISATREAKA